MRSLKQLGTSPFIGNRSLTPVLLYLLSTRLKSIGVCPNKLSNFAGISLKTSQRYVYNSFPSQSVNCLNLELVEKILMFVDTDIDLFFQLVYSFKNSNYSYATYDLDSNSFTFYTEEDYLSIPREVAVLDHAIIARFRLINKLSDIIKPHLAEYDNVISKFPSELCALRESFARFKAQ